MHHVYTGSVSMSKNYCHIYSVSNKKYNVLVSVKKIMKKMLKKKRNEDYDEFDVFTISMFMKTGHTSNHIGLTQSEQHPSQAKSAQERLDSHVANTHYPM